MSDEQERIAGTALDAAIARLTDDERTSEAGQPLCVVVAKHVMGWTLARSNQSGKYNGTRYWEGAPYGQGQTVGWHWNPLEKMDQAFMVVEAMRVKGWRCDIGLAADGVVDLAFYHVETEVEVTVLDDNLPSAICLAAIEALSPDSAVVESPTEKP